MRALMTAAALALALPISGCGQEADSAAARDALVPLTIKAPGRAHVFRVEVARTPEAQAKGLMFRTSLPVDGGMLFPFARPRFASFWMKNTLIPLDMIFIRADGSIDRIAENTIPENLEPVVSGGEVTAVLELAGGTAARLGIEENATVTWTDQ